MRIGNIEVYGVIYKITNKINGKCYIGQTCKKNGFKDRYVQYGESLIEKVYNHYLYRKERDEGYNIHLLRSIEKYGFDAFEVIEKFDIAFSRKELLLKEKCWIAIYKSNDDNFGYNKTLGGEGTYGYSFWNEKDESELKILRENKSKMMKGKNNPNYKRNQWAERTYEENQIIKNKRKKTMSEKSEEELKEISKKISEANKGKRHADFNGKNNPRAKSVICLTTKRIFFTVKEGAEYYGVSSSSSITRCCKGKLKYAGKYQGRKLVWRCIKKNHNKRYRVNR